MFETPIVFFIFNRPDLTSRVFERIAAQKPRHLLVVADGPRTDAERELCDAARAVVQANWPCRLETLFSEENLGCQKRIASGLNWAFSRCEEIIVLEDDCLPSPEFFSFCQHMLARYRDDERVMHVSGCRFLPSDAHGESHYFSRHVHVWGWASWQRAWRLYDGEMKAWKERRHSILALMKSKEEAQFYARLFDEVASGQTDTWDIQWMLSCFAQSGLSVIPDVNLVSNLGFRADATHTKEKSVFAQFPLGERLKRPDPDVVFADHLRDARVMTMSLPQYSLTRRVIRRLNRTVSKFSTV